MVAAKLRFPLPLLLASWHCGSTPALRVELGNFGTVSKLPWSEPLTGSSSASLSTASSVNCLPSRIQNTNCVTPLPFQYPATVVLRGISRVAASHPQSSGRSPTATNSAHFNPSTCHRPKSTRPAWPWPLRWLCLLQPKPFRKGCLPNVS